MQDKNCNNDSSISNDDIQPEVFLGQPLRDRAQTEQVMTALFHGQATTQDRVYGQGPFILSDIPAAAKGGSRGVCLGIDEAGRGSVLGPMIYGGAFWVKPQRDEDEKKVFADSKQLTEERRSFLWKNHILKDDTVGFAARVLTAAEISRNMWRSPESYNLNHMSHDAAIQIIQRVLDEGVNLEHCYIDTVGNASQYKFKLEQTFSKYSIDFTVEPKADDKYPTCSAASVVAKVTRDSMVQFLSSQSEVSMGSGYPSDPTCKAWIRHYMEHEQACPVYGFPAAVVPWVRFSWNPIKLALEHGAARSVVFEADELDEEEEYNPQKAAQVKRQRNAMKSFLGSTKRVKRYPYMEQKGFEVVSEL